MFSTKKVFWRVWIQKPLTDNLYNKREPHYTVVVCKRSIIFSRRILKEKSHGIPSWCEQLIREMMAEEQLLIVPMNNKELSADVKESFITAGADVLRKRKESGLSNGSQGSQRGSRRASIDVPSSSVSSFISPHLPNPGHTHYPVVQKGSCNGHLHPVSCCGIFIWSVFSCLLPRKPRPCCHGSANFPTSLRCPWNQK